MGIILFQSTDIAGAKDPDYPTKPITLFIAYGVGGTTDMTFRAF
jgi:tripartite-type tricarboxylate transporter receptor subunit TctC